MDDQWSLDNPYLRGKSPMAQGDEGDRGSWSAGQRKASFAGSTSNAYERFRGAPPASGRPHTLSEVSATSSVGSESENPLFTQAAGYNARTRTQRSDTTDDNRAVKYEAPTAGEHRLMLIPHMSAVVLQNWVCHSPHAHHTQRCPQPPDDTSFTYRSEGVHLSVTLALNGDTNGRTIRNAPPPLSLKSTVGPSQRGGSAAAAAVAAGGNGGGSGGDRAAVSGVSSARGTLKPTDMRDLLQARHSQQSPDGALSSDGLDIDGDGGTGGGDGDGDVGGGGYTLASMISNDQSVRNRMSSQSNPRSGPRYPHDTVQLKL